MRSVAERLAEGFVGQEDSFDNWETSDMTIRKDIVSIKDANLLVDVEGLYETRNLTIHTDTDMGILL